MLQPQFYFLSPVQVIQVTKENIQEAAEWCGGDVLEIANRRDPKKMDQYVHVPVPENSAISWAFPGMFITRRLVIAQDGNMKISWAVFKRDYFEKNYFTDPSVGVAKTWEKQASVAKRKKREEVRVKVNVGDAFREAMEKSRNEIVGLSEELGIDPDKAQALLDSVEKVVGPSEEELEAAGIKSNSVTREAESAYPAVS